LVAYHTAYLKANYPPEFMAAAMTNEMGDTKKLAVILEEARRLNLAVLPPSINASQAHFIVENGKIRMGLGAIKGAGLSAIESMVRVRENDGAFKTLFSMTKNLDLRQVGKKALESLAGAGALDDLEGHRGQLFDSISAAIKYAQQVQADRAAGQSSLFGDGFGDSFSLEPNLPMVAPWSKAARLKAERELIGFYVSGHPLEQFAAEARAFASAQLGDLDGISRSIDSQPSENGRENGGYRPQGPLHRFCGIITEVQHRTTRNGKPLVFATIEDFTGQGEIVCFSSEYDRFQQYLKQDEIIFVRGNTDIRGGSVKIKAVEIMPMWKVRDLIKSIVLRVDAGEIQVKAIEEFRDLCDANRGSCKLYFDIAAPDLPGGRQRIHSRKYVVEPTPDLMNGITRLFGMDNVVLESDAL
jgi:DNA polymerase-3 subunit alpha